MMVISSMLGWTWKNKSHELSFFMFILVECYIPHQKDDNERRSYSSRDNEAHSHASESKGK